MRSLLILAALAVSLPGCRQALGRQGTALGANFAATAIIAGLGRSINAA